MEKRHNKYNISYTMAEAKNLENLNSEQAKAIADHINFLRQELEETRFLLASNENGWDVPETIEDDYRVV